MLVSTKASLYLFSPDCQLDRAVDVLLVLVFFSNCFWIFAPRTWRVNPFSKFMQVHRRIYWKTTSIQKVSSHLLRTRALVANSKCVAAQRRVLFLVRVFKLPHFLEYIQSSPGAPVCILDYRFGVCLAHPIGKCQNLVPLRSVVRFSPQREAQLGPSPPAAWFESHSRTSQSPTNIGSKMGGAPTPK